MEIAVMDRVQNYHTEVDPMAQNLTGLPLQQAILLLMAADYCLSVCVTSDRRFWKRPNFQELQSVYPIFHKST